MRGAATKDHLAMLVRVVIDDELLAAAQKYVGETDTSAIIHLALQALIAREAGRRLALLGGSQPGLKAPPRRRTKVK